ncbi:TPA: DUF1002 domain-containing protein [Staphylococcus aureus]|nr:DUF1002 domain-containing protein [Staphylococcus aureus]HDE9869360.1 DUF1002 domain-containing protein [Staphylococcus aureus]HDG2601076.1 DUF1002 domain-containing protein [Staphylococcus aureus]HDH1976565.1 DUF1002 domain-containing protein [Staphylococcus aureus]HDY5190147.1 DUF1002 domain-containing protein [Staphylococcus aureus]
MKKNIITALAVSSLLLVNSTAVTHAESNSGESHKELEHDIYIEGADLNNEQAEETKEKLNVKDDFKSYEVSTQDVSKYTGGTYDTIYSSATITPKKFGKGIDVEITTPENITRITKEQYINACITSGIENAKIKVASVEKVTGEGALTGIYKALEEEGIEVNQDDIQKANEEMDNLATINDEQKDNGNDVNEPLNNAVADMKEQVADKKANGDSISREDVQNIVDNTLTDKGLDKVLNDSQKEKIVVIIYNASQSNAMKTNPESIKKQASKLKDGLSDKVKDFDSKNDGVLSKLWNDFVSWFKNFINAIIDFFKNIF